MDLKRWCHFHYINLLFLFGTYRIVRSHIQCTPGMGTPGYTIPQGDIVIEYGNPLDIMCIIVNSTQNNVSLSFTRNNVPIPPEMLDVVNSTALKLHIDKPAKASGDTYTCQQGDTMICLNRVTVGTKPQPVTDFDCVGLNYDNLTCSWTAPDNYVKTNYNLTFVLGGRSARRSISCPEMKSSENGNRKSCFWNVSTTPQYRLVHEVYNFTLTMSNDFGTNQINKIFNHFAHVLSGPPENLTVISTTPESIYLYWVVPFSMRSFTPGVHHRILYQCEYGEKKWHNGGLIDNKERKPSIRYNLTGLQYAHTLCDIRISLRSAKALPDDESMWSRNASITVRTSSKIPDSPPETNVGSFEIAAVGNKVQFGEAYIYWKQIPEEQKNGPDFRYNISVDGNSSIRPIEITNTYARFKDLSITTSYVFRIWSQNINGSSSRKSTIYVPRKIDRVKDPVSFTKVEFKEGLYELTWEPPKLLPGQYITNYTIFYCRNDKDRPYQCNGMLNWTVVSNETTNKTIMVEKSKIFQFAISANTYNGSSGMVWADCTIIHNKNMGKMKTVWINDVGPTFIALRWKLECSDRIGSVEGYIVYYCPIISPTNMDCKAPQQNSTFKGRYIQGGNITNLIPYTTYMLTVSVITKHTTYSQQSDPLYNTTHEAAPSRPRNLRVVSTTNSTVFMAWDPPEALNGKLKFYRLTYVSGHRDFVTKEIDSTEYELDNLRSYERYNITIAACTVACSETIQTSVLTRMGYPSKIRKPTVDYRNGSLITITWFEPSEPGGNIDHYDVRFKQKHKHENKTLFLETKTREYVINNCGNSGQYNNFYVSVRAVNMINNKTYKGVWSDELANYCETPVNYIMIILLVVVIGVMIFMGVMFTRLYRHCEGMRKIEIQLPPGLDPIVQDHTLVPWSTEKHQDNRALYSPPDEELLLEKIKEGRHFSGDSSGCSSGHNSVTSSLESGTHISSSSDSGTEQPGNYCAVGIDPKVDSSSYISVNTIDANKSPYKTCDVSSESSPYVMTGDAVKTMNPGYIPFNQQAPIGKSTGYVVAGIKNCNGYIPFNQTDSVNKSTGYVVAGFKNCKLD